MIRFGKTLLTRRLAALSTQRGCRYFAHGVKNSVLPNEMQKSNYKIGDSLHGYRILRIEDVQELCLTAYHLKHDRSGAEHLHISRDDMNNAFAVSLRTTPVDDTGVAHILEHVALCGSDRYPVRDPFMKMLNRSMATFLNAFTGMDFTMYPFSTLNQVDYENLLRVYLDAVFFPKLSDYDFRQEAWRLENEDTNNKSSPIIFKGVVFNEMKGVFSSSSQIYLRHLLRNLFPSTTYSNESGGDPISIPNLTHQQLINFHRKHYHPSNAKFFTYGNFQLEFYLSLINDLVLKKFEHSEQFRAESKVTEQQKWSSAKSLTITCPADPLAPFPDRQVTTSVSFMLTDVTDTFEMFTLGILSHLLVSGQNSPFFESLLASGIGMDFSPCHGLLDFTKQTLFSIGVQGIHVNQIEQVQKIIFETFEKVAAEGFQQERLDATLHLIELSLKHQTKNFGVNLINNINPVWNHDGDPIAALRINQLLNKFKLNLNENRKFLQEKIFKYFLNNSHRLQLTMQPDEKFLEKNLAQEQCLLSKRIEKLNENDRQKLFQDGIELQKLQSAPEQNLNALPCLNIEKDISRDLITTNLNHLFIEQIPIQVSPQPTNKVNYFRSLFKLSENDLTDEQRTYLPLFCDLITKIGAGRRDYKQMDQEINLRTGGLSAQVHIAENVRVTGDYECGVLFSSYCLEANVEYMLDLWLNIFNEAKFADDGEHLMQLIKILSNEYSQSVIHNGHQYAVIRAASSLCDAAKLRELSQGLSYIKFLKNLTETNRVDLVIEKLLELTKIIFRKENLRCSLNAEPSNIRSSLNAYENFLGSLNFQKLPKPARTGYSNVTDTPVSPLNAREHHIFPSATNFISKAHLCVPFAHDAYAKLAVTSKLLNAKYLLKEVREKGGAYGGGSKLSAGGIFSFYSYRDPNLSTTLNTFNESSKWLQESGNYGKQEINEAKLAVFQEIDRPVLPGDQGMRQFLSGISDEMQHEHRMRILNVNKDDINEIADLYLTTNLDQSGVTVLGEESKETSENNCWKIVR